MLDAAYFANDGGAQASRLQASSRPGCRARDDVGR
jgi:hypothetical protein